jgi:hypothetical protein
MYSAVATAAPSGIMGSRAAASSAASTSFARWLFSAGLRS